MNYKQFFLGLIALSLVACKKDYHLDKIEGKRLEINDSLVSDEDLDAFIKPFREHVNSDLDSVIAYAVDTYTKNDGDLNTAIGNFLADAVLEQANPIYQSRTGNSINMVLLNHGGIRAIISKGNLTTRTAFEVMPFENTIVVVEMKGKLIKDGLIRYLQKAKRAHPISNLKVVLNDKDSIVETSINGMSIKDEQTYHVATIDYVYYGGDRMHFFKKGDSLHVLEYKLRNALIDKLKKMDTIRPVIDDRFIKIN
jgi:5'-nucleotidase